MHRRRRRGAEGTCSRPFPKKSIREKYFSGSYHVKFGHFWQLSCKIWAFCWFLPARRYARAGLRDSHVSGCLAVCYSRYCIKTETASVRISSPSDSPMISLSAEVWLVEKFARGHPQRGRFLRVGWVRTADFCDFSTYKTPYLRNGARYDQGYYWTLLGNRMSAFDWYQDQRPWMTLNWPWAAITRFLPYTSVFQSPPRKYEWT